MRKIFQYILMVVAVVATASCSNEMDEALQSVNNGKLQFVVGDFPTFGESPETRVIGTQDAGKTAWEVGDQIIITLTSQKFSTQSAAITYDGTSWSTAASLSYLENETPTVSVIYAPCYEVTKAGVMQLKEGMQLGMSEYLVGDCIGIVDGVMTITFEGAGHRRDYSRLRIAGLAKQTLTVTTTDFIPAGMNESGEYTYTLTTDDKGNAYLYGIFAEGATVSVKQGEVTLKDYTFTAEKYPGGTYSRRSYALDVIHVIDLSQYTDGTTVDITGYSRIIGDGNEYNLTLNITEDAIVIFNVGTSDVKLGGSINVADGKTLTLLVKGNAEHTVKDGISLGNGSNVIIEGDLTKENNKLTVTASGGNAGIGANNGVILPSAMPVWMLREVLRIAVSTI